MFLHAFLGFSLGLAGAEEHRGKWSGWQGCSSPWGCPVRGQLWPKSTGNHRTTSASCRAVQRAPLCRQTQSPNKLCKQAHGYSSATGGSYCAQLLHHWLFPSSCPGHFHPPFLVVPKLLQAQPLWKTMGPVKPVQTQSRLAHPPETSTRRAPGC